MLKDVSWFSRSVWGLLLAGLTLLILSPLVSKFGLAQFTVSFMGIAIGGLFAVLAALVAVFGLIRPLRDQGRLNTLIVFLGGLGIAGFLGYLAFSGFAAPPIHDITTNLNNPPQFKTIEARTYPDGQPFSDTQRRALHEVGYPDLASLSIAQPVSDVTKAAADVLTSMGLEIVDMDEGAGRIEATDTTFWFGFKDDVVVRVTAGDAGASLVDARSVSRVGLSDIGTNAKRISAFLAKLNAKFA
ncbi:MAG: DUF1499 domain-containing protein [Pseudomonadota bacterium]